MVNQSPAAEQNFEQYLKGHENKKLIRFITCGSVDDGKSTLIGRLLHDSKMIFEDQLAALVKDSKKMGTQGGELDLALLVDGLQSEREQGITIDVAYRYFATEHRKFIIADTPGHEQYTRNMATGASTADLAIILIDARYGVQTQTRRHSYIVSLLGIKNIIVAVNKMDLIEFSEAKFNEIKETYSSLIPKLPGYETICCRYIPISALKGDNVVNSSGAMPWYTDPPLMELLDSTEVAESVPEGSSLAWPYPKSFRFPVQYVNRPSQDFRGFCGTVASGKVSVGDEVTVLPSGKSSRIREIIAPTTKKECAFLPGAFAPMAVTLTTEDDIDISRGDMIVHTGNLPRLSNSLKVIVVWMDDAAMLPGKGYTIKSATTVVSGSFEHINYKVDVNSYERVQVKQLALNDIASCKLILNRPIAADPYRVNRVTGSFIVIDRITNGTVGAGMIVDVSRRETEKIPAGHTYTKAEIELNEYVRKHFPEWGCKKI